jgi:A/G-specific adenine glycosylase
MVSEIMLQQTQTERVVSFYRDFLKAFPTVRKLASASLREVLIQWQGLGYNRRGRFLHEAARTIVSDYGGRIPSHVELLEALPGIGSYTARAISVFAFRNPQVLIETNIRTVYLHHFFKNVSNKVHDREILELIAATVSKRNPRDWYYALMDYGSFLKREHKIGNQLSAHYSRQSPFKGSRRELRGIVIKVLTENATSTSSEIQRKSGRTKAEVDLVIDHLEKERIVKRKASGRLALA